MFQHGAARHTDASRAATTRPSRSPAPAFARLPHQLRSPRPPDLTRQSTPTSLTAWLLAGRSPDTWHLLGSSSGSNLLTTQTCTQSHVLTSPRAPRHHVNPTRPWFSPPSLLFPVPYTPNLPSPPRFSPSPLPSPLFRYFIQLRHRLIWSHHRITSRLAHAHTPLCVPRIQS